MNSKEKDAKAYQKDFLSLEILLLETKSDKNEFLYAAYVNGTTFFLKQTICKIKVWSLKQYFMNKK